MKVQLRPPALPHVAAPARCQAAQRIVVTFHKHMKGVVGGSPNSGCVVRRTGDFSNDRGASLYSLLLACAFAQGPVEIPTDIRGAAKPSRPVEVREIPRIFNKTITHPDHYLQLIEKHLLKLKEHDRYYTRFFTFDQSPEPLLADHTMLWATYYNTVNPALVLAYSVEVEGSNGRVFAFDLRNTRLTIEAVTAVFRRDKRFREPHIDSDLAERCRKLIGVQQDFDTLHCEVMVPAAWLMRNVMEPGNRTTDLYDLLYPEERFGPTQFKYAVQTLTGTTGVEKKKEWRQVETKYTPGKPWEGDGKHYNEAFTYKKWVEVEVDVPVKQLSITGQQKIVPKLLKDFPEDLAQAQERWGVTDAQKFLDKQKLFVKRGEVVAGSKNDKQRGSIVAYQDRIIEQLTTAGGFIYLRTRDFRKTSGIGNVANDPRGVALGDLGEVAGEHFFGLPNGLHHGFLTGPANQGRKRVEAGDAQVVHAEAIDKSQVVVANQYSCSMCHGRSNGFITPSNKKINDQWNRGVRLIDIDPDKTQAIEYFFRGWEEEMDVWRLPYKRALRTIGERHRKEWDGTKFSVVTEQFRDWYDAPLDLQQCAAELGIPKSALLILLATVKIFVDDKNERTSYDTEALLTGGTIPRDEWDDFLFRKIALILSAARNAETPHPLFKMFYPDLLRQVTEKRK